MSRRRAALAVSVFSLLTLSVIAVVTPVRAQTEVDDARQEADRAADAAEDAYEIVDAAVTERAEIEDRLFATLDRYQANAQLLAEFSASLERLNDTLSVAEARQESTRDSFEAQAVAAYMNAVGTAGVLVIDSATIETAMVTQETLGRASRATLESLDGYLAFRTEVDALRSRTLQQAQETETVQADLDADAADLEQLFATANAEVAAAYRSAITAQADLSRANRQLSAAEAAATTTTTARPPTTAPTTTTAPTSTSSTIEASSTSAPPTTTTAPTTTAPTTTTTAQTTTTTTTPGWPPIPISSATASWRSLLEVHFAPDLVLDALVIIECESNGDPNAVNPYSGASGLFQFMPGTWAVASVEAGVGDQSVFDGEANIIAASWLAEYYRSRGYDPWRPWVCRSYL